MTEEVKKEEPKDGAFLQSLIRTNRQIRRDRAEAIGENAELIFKRAVEDLNVDLKELVRDRENMLDQSPDSATSLKVATDFDARAYVAKDIELGVKIRNTEIKLDIAQRRYKHLFGGK